MTERGRAQALALARALAPATGRRPAAATVVSSPLRRARETAEAFGLPVRVDERWVELDYGQFEGRGAGELRASLQRGWNDPEWAPPGGESLSAVARRVAAACADLAAEAPAGGDVVVVTHVSPIKAAAAWALGTGPEVAWRMHVDVASITTIAVREGGVPVLISFNQTAHLAGRTPSEARLVPPEQD